MIESYTSPTELDYIDVIDAPGVNGTVELYVMSDGSHPTNDGASFVHVIDLSGATESHIVHVIAANDLADWNLPLKATSITYEIFAPYSAIVNGVDVQRLDGGIVCDSLGDVHVRDGSGATHNGYIRVVGLGGYSKTIDVQGSIQYWIYIHHDLNPGGSITVNGDALREVRVLGRMQGPITVTGDLHSAEIGTLENTLTVGRDLISDPVFWGLRVRDEFAPSGYVDVAGTFWNPWLDNISVQGRIEVGETLIGGEIHGVAENASIQAKNISILHMNDRLYGAMSATQALADVQIVAGIGETGTVSAASISDLTISSIGVAGAVTAAAITNLEVIPTGVSGTVSATEYISYSLLGNVAADATVSAPAINNLVVTGGVAGTVSAGTELTSSTFGSIDPNGLVETNYLRDVTVSGSLEGKLEAWGTVDGTLQVGGLASTGSVHVGTLAGTFGCISNMWGNLDVESDLTGSSVWVSPTVRGGPDGNLYGDIVFGANALGTVHIQGNIQETGSIYVAGVLDDVNSNLSGGYITISRSMLPGATITVAPGQNFTPDTEFVTARFDGWASGESGFAIDPNATVTIGNHTPCHGDCPDINVRAVTECRGDFSQDGAVDFDDVNPFMYALATAPETYSIDNPGLGGTSDNYTVGARLFHGDCNCDGAFNFDDINPFVARITGNICDPGCSGSEELMGAEALAAGMRAHVPPVRHPALRAFVAQVIAHHHNRGNQPQRVYWSQVLAYLGQ